MPNYNDFGLNRTTQAGYDLAALELTPNNGLSDGIAPAGRFIVAPYLPLIRYIEDKFEHVTIGSGKPLALDSNGSIVPAGLKLEAEAYAASLATNVETADANALLRYTSVDVAKGVKNAKGVAVVANEPVVKSFFTGTTQDIKVSFWVGVAQYNIFRHKGGDNINPATWHTINFNRQPVIAFLCDYHMQYPLVKDLNAIRTAPLQGIAGVVSTKTDIAPGSFLTYDRESNFVPCDDLYSFGTTPSAAVIGQVTAIRQYKDPDTNAVIGNHNMLDKVVAPNAATASVLNQVPNAQNEGMGTFITYSNGYGVVEFGLHFR